MEEQEQHAWGSKSGGKGDEILPLSPSGFRLEEAVREGVTRYPGWDGDAPEGVHREHPRDEVSGWEQGAGLFSPALTHEVRI